jgi:hypothetical protein
LVSSLLSLDSSSKEAFESAPVQAKEELREFVEDLEPSWSAELLRILPLPLALRDSADDPERVLELLLMESEEVEPP